MNKNIHSPSSSNPPSNQVTILEALGNLTKASSSALLLKSTRKRQRKVRHKKTSATKREGDYRLNFLLQPYQEVREDEKLLIWMQLV